MKKLRTSQEVFSDITSPEQKERIRISSQFPGCTQYDVFKILSVNKEYCTCPSVKHNAWEETCRTRFVEILSKDDIRYIFPIVWKILTATASGTIEYYKLKNDLSDGKQLI